MARGANVPEEWSQHHVVAKVDDVGCAIVQVGSHSVRLMEVGQVNIVEVAG